MATQIDFPEVKIKLGESNPLEDSGMNNFGLHVFKRLQQIVYY